MPSRTASAALLAGLVLAGCRQDMHNQPRYRALQPSRFFADGRSSRPLIEGTVARGHLRSDREYWTGMRFNTAAGNRPGSTAAPQRSQAGQGAGGSGGAGGGATGSGSGSGLGSAGAAQIGGGGAGTSAVLGQTAGGGAAAAGAEAFDPNYVTTFPYPVTKAMVVRGRERYNIFCSPCHGYTGQGNGMIVQRGLRQPPSFHMDRLRAAPVGHFFDVITNGFGAMFAYGARIQVQDRWAIISYIRALQLSQGATPAELPGDVLTKVNEGEAVTAGGFRPGNGNLYLGGTPTLGSTLLWKKYETRTTENPPNERKGDH